MRCADLEELISAYADGQTVPAQSEVVEAHLAGCARCTAVLQKHRRTRHLLNLAFDDAWTPPDLRLRVALAHRHRRQRARRLVWPAGLAACVAIGVLVAAIAGSQVSGWGAAGPVAVRIPSPVTTVARSEPTHASCPRTSPQALARCLGVSRYMLPTVLAEGVAMVQPAHNAINLPPRLARPSAQSAAYNPATKGGETRAVSNGRHRGLVPM